MGQSLLGMHSCKEQTSIKYQGRIKDSSHSTGQEICTLEVCFTLIAASILQAHRGHMYLGFLHLSMYFLCFLNSVSHPTLTFQVA